MNMNMNVNNYLYKLLVNKEIGRVSIIKAYDAGYIDGNCANYLLNHKVDYTLEEAVKFKREECSYFCSANITSGVDVTLSNGETKHFSLTERDQINLATKMINVAVGLKELEYHSDGEPCVYYNADDMSLICTTAQAKVTLETTYFNCISMWIAGCKTPEEVMAISYGDDIPEEYWTEPWRRIIEKSKPSEETVTSDTEQEEPSNAQDTSLEVESELSNESSEEKPELEVESE